MKEEAKILEVLYFHFEKQCQPMKSRINRCNVINIVTIETTMQNSYIDNDVTAIFLYVIL